MLNRRVGILWRIWMSELSSPLVFAWLALRFWWADERDGAAYCWRAARRDLRRVRLWPKLIIGTR